MDQDGHQDRHDAASYQRIEVSTGERRRRSWSDAEKAPIVAESADPETSISGVARRNGVNRGLLSVWRRQALLASSEAPKFVQVRLDAAVEAQPNAIDKAHVLTGPAERIEVMIAGATVRVPVGVDAATLERVLAGEIDAMISFGPMVRVFVATQPIDFRKGVHGLVALVAEGLGGKPYSGDGYVFRSKRSDRLKLLVFDVSGMVLATKWLENGGFAWPPVHEGTMPVTGAQLAMLIEGLAEWSRVVPKVTKRPTKVA